MKFSIDDKIILKRTGEEGHVVSYINNQMVEVEINGIRFPAFIDEIDHPYLKWFTEKKSNKSKSVVPEQLPVERIKSRAPKVAKGISISFIPVFKIEEMEDVVDHLKIHLLNETPHNIGFRYDVRFSNESSFSHEGKLHAFGHLYLHNIAYDEMNDQPRFHWAFTNADDTSKATEEGVLRIRPQKLFEHINQLLLNNEPSFAYLLTEEFSDKQAMPEEVLPPAPPPKKSGLKKPAKMGLHDLPRQELDLHIEQLVDTTRGLSNAEMLHIQCSTLQRYLHLAILHRQQRMVIIHGLGKGVLRDEVHKILKETPEVSRYSDGWHGNYGFGATEVWFKY